mmetsp:Transcript_43746/g.138267  ORF Transcript_43746/g.138267 Transcript_43746/m.138267 type:complete len:149 (+) Transcript_43746:649-1095(+)
MRKTNERVAVEIATEEESLRPLRMNKTEEEGRIGGRWIASVNGIAGMLDLETEAGKVMDHPIISTEDQREEAAMRLLTSWALGFHSLECPSAPWVFRLRAAWAPSGLGALLHQTIPVLDPAASWNPVVVTPKITIRKIQQSQNCNNDK